MGFGPAVAKVDFLNHGGEFRLRHDAATKQDFYQAVQEKECLAKIAAGRGALAEVLEGRSSGGEEPLDFLEGQRLPGPGTSQGPAECVELDQCLPPGPTPATGYYGLCSSVSALDEEAIRGRLPCRAPS